MPSASNLGNVSVSSPVVAAAATTDEAESFLSLCESSIAFSGGEASRTYGGVMGQSGGENHNDCLVLRRYGDGDDAGEHVGVWYTNRQASAAALELPNSVPKRTNQ